MNTRPPVHVLPARLAAVAGLLGAVLLPLAGVAPGAGPAKAYAKPPAKPPARPAANAPAAGDLRAVGPAAVAPGGVYLVYAEQAAAGGKGWERVNPDGLTAEVAAPGKLVDDPAGVRMNPITVEVPKDATGTVAVKFQAGGKAVSQDFKVAPAKPAGEFSGAVNLAAASHRFDGLGAGVLFYDNQFAISDKEDIYDWCFRDVHAAFLHLLIRPNYEPQNDNADPKSLDLSKFDFKSTEHPFKIAKEALKRNPDLKVYASLYSPPPWMKANNATAGNGSLKEGPQFRAEVAEYVFAWLKHARAEGIPVHYLAFFNEPDFPHTQDGMLVSDLGVLADTFHDCAAALDAFLAADPELKDPKLRPVYVFPDTLGAGSITRAGLGTQKLRSKAAQLKDVGVWGVHDYWNQTGDYWDKRFRELRAVPGAGDKPVWMTEWAQRDRHGDLASGVEYGHEILNALRSGASAWMAFEWCHPAGNQAGLISTDWGPGKPTRKYWRSKAYHVFRQVANTTPVGGQVLAMSGRYNGPSQANGRGVEYLAVREVKDSKADGRVVVHLMNTEPAPVNYRVTVAGGATAVAESWLTGPAADVAAGRPEDASLAAQGNAAVLSGAVPAYTLLTVVLR